MSLLKILRYPDKRLRKIAKPVVEINQTIHQIVDDMFETMYFEEGIGLAATQVNIHQRIIVIHDSENSNQHLVLINPEFLRKSGSTGTNEGCLSIPNEKGFVLRAKEVIIRALNLKGNSFKLKAENLLAICIQHEMDHLIGKLFIDYLSLIKRQRIYKKMKKLEYIDTQVVK